MADIESGIVLSPDTIEAMNRLAQPPTTDRPLMERVTAGAIREVAEALRQAEHRSASAWLMNQLKQEAAQ